MSHDIYDIGKDFILPGTIGILGFLFGFVGVIRSIQAAGDVAKDTANSNAALARETATANAQLAREQVEREADLTRLQHQRQIDHDKKIIKSCLIGELTQCKIEIDQLVDQIKKEDPCIVIRKMPMTQIYDANLNAMGLLEPNLIGAVINAYAGIQNLSKITKIYHTAPSAVYEDDFYYNLFVEPEHKERLEKRLLGFHWGINFALAALKGEKIPSPT